MKILFVRERWADGNPSMGESDGSYMIATCWQKAHAAALGAIKPLGPFYYDDPPNGDKAELNEQLLATCVLFMPDLVMFSHLLSWGDRNIKKETWEKIRSIERAKVVGVWHESSPDVVRVADEHADCVDLNLFLDTTKQFLNFSKRPEKCFGLYDPRDATKFKPADNKDIAMLFNGTLQSRPSRCQGMFTLLANGIPITHIGGRNELFIPESVMVEMLGRAKICLNFSEGGPGKHYKGRVAEALLSGCLLMEQENDEANSILTPFKDFVPFNSPDDLLQKAAYYLSHDTEREKIAASGRASALEKLDGRAFWKSLFERLEIEYEN